MLVFYIFTSIKYKKLTYLLMKKKLLLGSILLSVNMFSQTYTPLQLDGFNSDVIAEGIGSALSKTTNDVDGVNFCFKSLDWQSNANTPTTGFGLPINGLFNSQSNQNISFQLKNYSENNSVRIEQANTSITSTIANTLQAKRLYVVATGGSGQVFMNVTVTFSDNTTQTFNNISVEDWYNGWQGTIAINQFGRINRTTDEVESSWGAPNLFQIELNLDIINQTKNIQSIQYTKSSGDGILNIFAVTAEVTPTCPPASITTSNATQNSIDVSLAPLDVPYLSFTYEVRTSGAPGSGPTGLVNTDTVTSTNFTISNLPSSSEYYIYVKTNCSTSESGPYGESSTFSTLCDVISTYYQNFNNLEWEMLPMCWNIINIGDGYYGAEDWNGYNGTVGYYLSNSWENSPTDQLILVSPQTNNLGNGTYRVRFKAKGSEWAYPSPTLNIVTLNGSGETSTVTLVENVQLSQNYQEFYINLPLTTDDYFGFQHTQEESSTTIFIDDVHFELIPSCPDITGLNATQDFSTLSAVLNWNSDGDLFEVEWGNQNFNLGEGTLIDNINTNSTEIIVDQEGFYTYYVRRNCGDEDYSPWAGPYNFTIGYCDAIPTSVDGNGISSISFNETSYEFTDDTYQFSEDTPTLYSNYENTSEITFETDYQYQYHIWIDTNENGNFEESEIVKSGTSLTYDSPEIVSNNITLASIPSGNYRMRLAAADSGQETADPCYSDSYGLTIDFNVNITTPCFVPEEVNFISITTESSVLSTSFPNQTYVVEYGIQGFTQGEGMVINNISSGYVFENLSSGETYDVYLKVLCDNDLESDWSSAYSFTTLCDTPIPTGSTTQVLINDQTFEDVDVNGQNIKIYSNANHQNIINPSSPIQSGTYYFTQTDNCESSGHLAITIQVVQRIAQPTVSDPYIVCESTTLEHVVLGLVNNSTVKWYANETSTEVLPISTVIDTNSTYYVTQSNQFSESYRKQVNFVINSVPSPLTTTQFTACGNMMFNQIALPENYDGTLVWFTNSYTNTPIYGQTVVTSGVYYVSQFVNGCLSDRIAITIDANGQIPMPTANVIDICGTGTVADLDPIGINGAQYNWYASLNSTAVLSPTTTLTTGTYYVEQIVNGCASSKKAVSVRVNSKVAPVIQSIQLCANTKFQDINLPTTSGVEYLFFTTPTSTLPINTSDNVTTGTYYIARKINGCESNRAQVQINVLPVPNAPTGENIQVFDNNSVTISDIIMDQSNIVWYSTYQDAIANHNPLQTNTPLIDGTTYYGVLSSGECRSIPTSVTVQILLSNDSLDLTTLKVYPNPMENEVFIEYQQSIDFVEIYSITGSKINSYKVNDTSTNIDVSQLSSGTYFLKIYVEKSNHTIKLLKK